MSRPAQTLAGLETGLGEAGAPPSENVNPTSFGLATRVTPLEIGIECKRILEIEGASHIYGRYVADYWDAAIYRAEAAERHLRAIKAADFHAKHCVWCEQENRGPMVSVGGDRFVHAEKCLDETAAFLNPEGDGLVAVMQRAVA